VITLIKRFIEYWNKATSNNLHNYIVVSFLSLSILSVLTALGMTIVSWWRGLPPPPKEIFSLLEMELYALGAYASVNATAHVTKALGGKSGLNTAPPEPEPRPDA